MHLIDTHTHLYAEEFDADRDAVIERAKEAGVRCLLLPNIDSSSISAMQLLADRYPDLCFPMMGLHPTSVKENYKEELTIVYENLKQRKYIAVGEIGLDLYWDKTFFAQQCEALEVQIRWAREMSLPLVIHTRDAFPEMLDLLRKNQEGGYKGGFHSFGGTLDQALQAIDMGFVLGINGVLTFKNSKLSDVIREIPLEKILLETDSPYLTPVPKRGQRNESTYLVYIAEKIAQIKEVSVDKVAEATSTNAQRIFNL